MERIFSGIVILIVLILIGCKQHNTNQTSFPDTNTGPVINTHISDSDDPKSPVPTENSAVGTQDGGGGDLNQSTAQEVLAAVKVVKDRLALEKKGPYSLYKQLTLTLYKSAKELKWAKSEEFLSEEQIKLVNRTLLWIFLPRAARHREILDEYVKHKNNPDFNLTEHLRELYDGNNDYAENIADYINELKIIYNHLEPCPAPDKKEAYASVSGFTFNAEICFSVHKLKTISPQSLTKNIFVLWMHELTHVNGFKNDELAQTIGNVAELAYETIFLGTQSDLPYRAIGSLMTAEMYISTAIQMLSIENKSVEEKKADVISRVAVAVGVLETLADIMNDFYTTNRLFSKENLQSLQDEFVMQALHVVRKIERLAFFTAHRQNTVIHVKPTEWGFVEVGSKLYLKRLLEVKQDIIDLQKPLRKMNTELNFKN